MLVKNAENIFTQADIYYCYSPPLKKHLCNNKKLGYIGKGVNGDSGKTYWLFIRNEELEGYLKEWSDNSKNGIKAVE